MEGIRESKRGLLCRIARSLWNEMHEFSYNDFESALRDYESSWRLHVVQVEKEAKIEVIDELAKWAAVS